MKKKGIFLSVVCLVIAALVVYSCGKSNSYNSGGSGGTGNPPPGPTTVSIANMSFASANLTVVAGTTVTWTNNDEMAHTVTSDSNGGFDSGNLAPGAKFSWKFSTAGSYPYHCTIHPTMTGKITVKSY